MRNSYEVRGKTTVIFIERRNGEIYEALIDTEDLPRATKEKSWALCHFSGKWNQRKKFYCRAHRRTEGKKRIDIMLHHLVFGKPPKGMMVDHINGDPLDNRKCNLRFVTNHFNQINRTQLNINNKSGYPGVRKEGSKYTAYFKLHYRTYYAGRFETPEEAYIAREQLRANVLDSYTAKEVKR